MVYRNQGFSFRELALISCKYRFWMEYKIDYLRASGIITEEMLSPAIWLHAVFIYDQQPDNEQQI